MTTSNPPSPAPDPRKRLLTRTLFAAKIVVSASMLVILFRWIDPQAILHKYTTIHWGWFITGLLIHQTQNLISTTKWFVILRADGVRPTFLFLWKTYLIGNFLSLFLPTSFGGDVYRVWALNQQGLKMRKSAASVLFDRVSGVIALVSIGTIGMVLLVPAVQSSLLVVAYITGMTAFVVVTSDFALARLPQPKSKFLGFPFRVLTSFNQYRKSLGSLATVAGLSGLFQFNIILIVICYARSLGVLSSQISALELIASVPVIYLTELLPIAINGIGVRDGAFAYFFGQLGGTAEQGLAVSLLIIVIRYAHGLLGGVLFLVSILRGHSPRPVASRV